VRKDRNKLDIEYEKQRKNCKFSPETNKNKRAASKIKDYISTGKMATKTSSYASSFVSVSPRRKLEPKLRVVLCKFEVAISKT
jgi:hypothetical protein